MTSVAPAAERIYVGMDVSRDKIAVAVLRPGEDVPAVEVISHDGEMVRRLIGKFADRSVLAACYEAGPGGYELYRLLASMGVACDVVAPALIPKAAADRVKTDRRDCVRLALSHRAGLLTAIRVPSEQEEAVRDLVRTRADLVDDRKRMMQRIGALLQRHGRVWRAPRWTYRAPRVAGPAVVRRAGAAGRAAHLPGGAGCPRRRAGGAGSQLRGCWASVDPLASMVRQLGCYRGIAELTAPDPGRRGRRLPPVPLGPGVHGLHRPDALGVLQRRAHPPGRHHQGRPAADPRRADRGGLGLPAPARDRGHAQAPAGRVRRRRRWPARGRPSSGCTPPTPS